MDEETQVRDISDALNFQWIKFKRDGEDEHGRPLYRANRETPVENGLYAPSSGILKPVHNLVILVQKAAHVCKLAAEGPSQGVRVDGAIEALSADLVKCGILNLNKPISGDQPDFKQRTG